MVSVFLSYAREDKESARQIVDHLVATGVTVAWDQDQTYLPFSAKWRDEIEKAIRDADKFVFLISPASVASAPCKSELEAAETFSKQLIPLYLHASADEAEIPPALAERNWIFVNSPEALERGLSELDETLVTDIEWIQMHAAMSRAAAEWSHDVKDRSRLLRGRQLREAEEWLLGARDHPRTPPTLRQQEFVGTSRSAATRASRTLQSLIAAGAVLVLIFAVFAAVKWHDATKQATAARAQSFASQSAADLATNPTKALRLAVQSNATAPSSTGTTALRDALAADPERLVLSPDGGPGEIAAWSPTSETIAAIGAHDTVELWDARTGRMTHRSSPTPDGKTIAALQYSPNGRWISVITTAGDLLVLDATNAKAVSAGSATSALLTAGKGASMTWNPANNAIFVFGGLLRGALSLDPVTRKLTTFPLADVVDSLDFAPTSSTALVTFAGYTTVPGMLHSFTTGASTLLRTLHEGAEYDSCWTPDGSNLAVWAPTEAQDPTVRLFNSSGKQLYVHSGATTSAAACGGTNFPAFARKPIPYVATGDYEGNAFLIQGPSTAPFSDQSIQQVELTGHSEQINSVATSVSGAVIATGSDDGSVRTWDAFTGHQTMFSGRSASRVTKVSLSPDGALVLAVRDNGVVTVYDDGTGEPVVPVQTATPESTSTVGFLDGGRLAWGVSQHLVPETAGDDVDARPIDLEVIVWSARTGKQLHAASITPAPSTAPIPCSSALSLDEPGGGPCSSGPLTSESTGLDVSDDGKFLAYATTAGSFIYDFSTKQNRQLGSVGSTFVRFSGPDHQLVVTSKSSVTVWKDVHRWESVTARVSDPAVDVDVSADGSRIAAANASGSATVWRARDLSRLLTVKAVGGKETLDTRVALNGDGSLLATGDTAADLALWNVRTGAQLLSDADSKIISSQYPIAEIAFSGGRLIAANFPQILASDSNPAGRAVIVDTTSRQVVASLRTPGTGDALYDPGVTLSPDGRTLLTGAAGFGGAAGIVGQDGAADLSTGMQFERFQAAEDAPTWGGQRNLALRTVWSPDSTRLITGAAGIYECASCGTAASVAAAAQNRLRWEKPLLPGYRPPEGNPFE